MNRIAEIDARIVEIRSLLSGEGEADLDAINAELDALEQERATLQRREDTMRRIQTGGAGLERVDRAGGAPASNAPGAESEEYRNAWAAEMTGRRMAEEERAVYDRVNAEYRAYTHTTENQSVLIPETVVSGIWKRAEEAYPLWADVRKFAVSGTLTMKKFTGITANDATWYDEATSVADEENAFAEISLSGCELAKSVTVSWKLKAMAIADFIPFIEREIGERMGVALGNAVWSGKGTPGNGDTWKKQPCGIKTALMAAVGTPQVLEYSTLTEARLRDGVALLHSSNLSGACFYANNKTVWTVLANIQDGQKRSIFLNDVAVQGAVGRVFGMPVKVDAALSDGDILIGNARAGYWANVNRPMTMHTEEHVKARTTDYMGYAIVDGNVYDDKAFAYLHVSTDTAIGAVAYTVTQPAKNGTPQSTHDSGTGYTATIAWSPTAVSFAASTIYTATVTYTAASGYRFPETFALADVTGVPASAVASSVTATRVSATVAKVVAVYVATGA